MKPKRKSPKADKYVMQLYKAVENYVKNRHGSVAVIGGISVQQWPKDNEFVYHVAVKCCGRLPVFSAKSK